MTTGITKHKSRKMNVGAFDTDNEDNTSLIMGNEMALKRVTAQDEAKVKEENEE